MHALDILSELKRRGHSLAAVSRELDLSYSTCYAVIRGQRSKRVETRISQIIGIPPEEIWPERYPQARDGHAEQVG